MGEVVAVALFLDRHDLDGATAEEVAAAHVQDLDVQPQYGVRFITYWFDPARQTAFCLCDAPDDDTVATVHREAHGLVPNRVIRVDENAVRSFLGGLTEPDPGEPWVASGFRTVLFTDLVGSTEMTNTLGDAQAMEVLREHDRLVRASLETCQGREVKHTGDGIMASFESAVQAVACSVAIQRRLAERNAGAEIPIIVRIGVSAGEPVSENGDLFGATVQLAARLCAASEPGEILCSSAVRELCLGKTHTFVDRGLVELKGLPESVRIYTVALG